MRSVLRMIVKDITNILDESNSAKIKDIYAPLFYSVTNGDLSTLKSQSKIMLNCIREVVLRQQRRKIPTIIEGVSLVPSAFFDDGKPIYGFENNVVFINLFISDENKHLKRRISRCEEREYTNSPKEISESIINIRIKKNLELHNDTLSLSKKHNNVYSFDVSNLDQDSVVERIKQTIVEYLDISSI